MAHCFLKNPLSKTKQPKNYLLNFLARRCFSQLKIPFICNSLDINSGDEVVFSSGLLYKAVWASCAIPGIFPAYEQDKKVYMDIKKG
ncbi:MAG: patatin-like phospholipase family protein [bacterium]